MTAVGIVDAVACGLVYYVVASGLTLILGSLRVLTLAHGSAYLAGTSLAWRLHADTLAGYLAALGAAIPTGIALGAVGAALTWPLRRHGHLAQALATLGLSLIAAQMFAAATGGGWLPATPPPPLDTTVSIAGARYPAYRLLFIAAALLIALILWATMSRTTAGLTVRAVADDPAMAASIGIRPALVHTIVFAAGTVLAVLAGVLAAPIVPGGPGTDEQMLVMSLLIVVLGGAGDLRGAFVAALVTGAVTTIGVITAPAVAPFLLFAVLVAVVAIRPSGLGSRRWA
ncbi:branched-chain amino acid ABC transporter permease [Catellatospora methionotrophica]|uniref:branched-chain amino acid ABC transporter permease n=1 Tax=Catellatospora methionotrophica TaxID=121620 RepID=UPI00340F7BBC